LSFAISIICFIISAGSGEAAVVAGAETPGVVAVVEGALGCGDCAKATETTEVIAARAISAEKMRVFMAMIFPASPSASNKKERRK
jgi:hypothetical protein